MYCTDQLSTLSAFISNEQLQVIETYLQQPQNWATANHGDKQQLPQQLSVVYLAANGTTEWTNVLEAHRRFFDLHCTLEGTDNLVSKAVADCIHLKQDYNDAGDYILFNEKPVEHITVPAGNYCLISPAAAHMALYGDCGFVKKLVFKIPVNPDAA